MFLDKSFRQMIDRHFTTYQELFEAQVHACNNVQSQNFLKKSQDGGGGSVVNYSIGE